jgi:hypothetical protein
MAIRFAITRILPSVLIFAALLGAGLALDLVLHLAGAVQVGRWLGVGGTLLIMASFVYSLRKRRLIAVGAPRRLLQLHEALGWVGAVAVLVHGGVHFNALLPWSALAALLVVVASGLTGKFLLEDAKERVKARRAELERAGAAEKEVEAELLGQSLLVETMQRWRKVHMPVTMVFAGLALVHVAATLVFWRWAP